MAGLRLRERGAEGLELAGKMAQALPEETLTRALIRGGTFKLSVLIKGFELTPDQAAAWRGLTEELERETGVKVTA